MVIFLFRGSPLVHPVFFRLFLVPSLKSVPSVSFGYVHLCVARALNRLFFIPPPTRRDFLMARCNPSKGDTEAADAMAFFGLRVSSASSWPTLLRFGPGPPITNGHLLVSCDNAGLFQPRLPPPPPARPPGFPGAATHAAIAALSNAAILRTKPSPFRPLSPSRRLFHFADIL